MAKPLRSEYEDVDPMTDEELEWSTEDKLESDIDLDNIDKSASTFRLFFEKLNKELIDEIDS